MKPRRPAPSQSSDPRRTAFAASVQQCVKLLAQFDAIVEAHERDEQTLAALRTECAALDSSVDPMDSAAIAVLAGKERQVELLAKRVTSVEAQLDPLAVDLKAALLRSGETQREFLKPAHTALVEEVSSALRPHFRDAGRALQIGAETDSVRALVRTMTAHWTQDASYDPLTCARTVLPQLRTIADGEQPWLTGA